MMILMPLSTSTEVNLDNSRLMPISTKMIIQKNSYCSRLICSSDALIAQQTFTKFMRFQVPKHPNLGIVSEQTTQSYTDAETFPQSVDARFLVFQSGVSVSLGQVA